MEHTEPLGAVGYGDYFSWRNETGRAMVARLVSQRENVVVVEFEVHFGKGQEGDLVPAGARWWLSPHGPVAEVM